MKYLTPPLLSLLIWGTAHAAPPTTTFVVTTQTVTIPAGGYVVDFWVSWFCDDYPRSSAPGRIELRDAGDNLVGRVTASAYQTTGLSTFASLGSLSDVNWWMNVWSADGTPADGGITGQWHITGVPAGTYTLRFFEYVTWQSPLNGTTVWTETAYIDGRPEGSPPNIAWVSAPANAGSGQPYTVTAHGHDDDGNLVQVNVWKNGQPFAFAGGGNGTDGDSGNTTSDMGSQTVTFTAQAVDASGATSPVITHVVTINAPVNSPPTVTLLSPAGQTVTAGTTLTLSARATDPDGNLSGHNLDIQRPAGDWNFQGGFATGEPYQGGPVGSGADSTRTANFTFSDVGTYYVRSGAYDGSGWYHSATVAVTVTAPLPVQYALVTGAGAGGAVTPGGTYNAGTVVSVTATPDGIHDFAGWSGDAGGAANPLGVLLDGNKTVQANFSLKTFALTTSASAGGTVTPGGSYPYGTVVTLSATPDATHRFVGWAGDAGGAVPSVAVTIDGPKAVQAVFTDKLAQTITFPAPADQPVGGPPLALAATASSGLPVSYVVLSGPATLNGNLLQVTGPGAVTVQASQTGDALYLPATNVSRTFNSFAAAVLKYRPAGRTFLQSRASQGGVPFVLEKP